MKPSDRQTVHDNWKSVIDDVDQAVHDSGRDPSEVTIVGVTKYVDAETTALLVQAGCKHLGENRPQLLWDKTKYFAEHLFEFSDTSGQPADLQWHVIGHLQRNKVRRTLRCTPVIHSVDSDRLLREVADESTKLDVKTRVLLEVNISGDANKTGLDPDALKSALDTSLGESIEVAGLMAMAGWGTDSSESRRQFAAVRSLRDQMETQFGIQLPELSMGMSGDFREAVAEGATMVRIGSRIFAGVMEDR